MIKVLMVCHGNICRSPMAEFILKDMVEKEGLADKFIIKSAATSREEIGNPVHYGTQNVLNQMGINCSGKRARQITQKDYEEYDYILLMDKNNLRNMTRMFGTLDSKVKLLLEYANSSRDIADPWYTGNFNNTKNDVIEGCRAFLNYLKENELR